MSDHLQYRVDAILNEELKEELARVAGERNFYKARAQVYAARSKMWKELAKVYRRRLRWAALVLRGGLVDEPKAQ